MSAPMQYVKPRWIECPGCGRRYDTLIVAGWPDRFYEQHDTGCDYDDAENVAGNPPPPRRRSRTRSRRQARGGRYSRPYGAAAEMKG
jgi:hypothetical protein